MNKYETGIFLVELKEELERKLQKEIDYLNKEKEIVKKNSIDPSDEAIEINYNEKINEYKKGIFDSIQIIEDKRRKLLLEEMEETQ